MCVIKSFYEYHSAIHMYVFQNSGKYWNTLLNLPPASFSSLLYSVFDTDDGGDILLQTAGHSQWNTVLHSWRPYTS